MKFFLIGGTGKIGGEILAEALSRGHQVTALARDPAKLAAKPGLTVVKGDIHDSAALASQSAGQDAVIIAYNPGWGDPDVRKKTTDGADSVLAAARKAGVKRLFWVGGASSLKRADGVEVLDTMTQLPPLVREAIVGLREVLYKLRTIDDLDWTFFSPAEAIGDGPKTGKFRLGDDVAVADSDGKSFISRADYAVAVIDELERPQHIRKRFTIGY
jgi:putative NADH-flavin reductase